MKKHILYFLLLFIIGIPILIQYSCTDDKSASTYDGPLKLKSFYPDSGYLSSKIIIEAENLGTDPSQLSVYFNKKKGFISQSSGNVLMVYAPKLPGDDCIISVVKGKDSITFDKTFKYISRMTVDNVCGKPGSTLSVNTDLTSTTFPNWHLKCGCCDDEGNYYAGYSDFGKKTGGLALINEKNGISKSIIKTIVNDVIFVKKTGKIYAVPPFISAIHEIDPANDWQVKNRYLRVSPTTQKPIELDRLACLAYCDDNDYFYARTRVGYLLRFKLENLECEYVSPSKFHNGVGSDENRGIVSMKFDPTDPTKLYTSYGDKTVISVFDVAHPEVEEEVYAGIPGIRASSTDNSLLINGYRTESLFNWNNQLTIVYDPETKRKIMYISDAGTHTIRQIDMNTGMVTNTVGRHGISGNQSGTPLEATFSWPKGAGITPIGDIYISDSGTGCVRKLSLR